MTEKELKKLNRYQLLEMLIIQTERANDLQNQLDAALEQLNARNVQMAEIGSIAEASLHLSGIFEAAQSAADLYINAVKERTLAMEEEASRHADAIIQEADRKARQLLEETAERGQISEDS